MTKPSAASLILCSVFLAATACGNKASAPAPAALQTDEQKTIYALGLLLGGNIQVFNLTPEELELVKQGISDAVTGAKPQVNAQEYGPKLDQLAMARRMAGAATAKTKGKEYAEAAAKEAGATVLPSGVVYKTITAGTGASPAATDTVRVHYAGKLIDGTEFDSSRKPRPDGTPGQPAEFALNGVIPCWTQGVQKMKVGEKARLVCPSDVAYGDGGRPGIPPGATLDFEVELLDIKK